MADNPTAAAAPNPTGGNPVPTLPVDGSLNFDYCARTHFAKLDQYATDKEKTKVFERQLCLRNNFTHPLSSLRGYEFLTDGQKDMNGFGCRDLDTFSKFQFAINNAASLGLFDDPALAMALFNNLAPVIFHSSPKELYDMLTTDIPGVTSLSGFLHGNGYVPVCLRPGSKGEIQVGQGSSETDGQAHDMTRKWLFYQKKEPPINLSSIDGRVFEGKGRTPRHDAPSNVFAKSCQITIPVITAIASRINVAIAEGTFAPTELVGRSKAERVSKLKQRLEECWKRTVLGDNGTYQWGVQSSRIRRTGVGGGAKYLGLEPAEMPKGTLPPKADGSENKTNLGRPISPVVMAVYNFLLPAKIYYKPSPKSGVYREVTQRELARACPEPKLVNVIDSLRGAPRKEQMVPLSRPLRNEQGEDVNYNVWRGPNPRHDGFTGGILSEGDRQTLAGVRSFPGQPHPTYKKGKGFVYPWLEHKKQIKDNNPQLNKAPHSAAAYDAKGEAGLYRDPEFVTVTRVTRRGKRDGVAISNDVDSLVTTAYLQKVSSEHLNEYTGKEDKNTAAKPAARAAAAGTPPAGGKKRKASKTPKKEDKAAPTKFLAVQSDDES